MGKFSNMLYMIDLLNTGNKYSLKDIAGKIGVTERMVRYYKDELEKNGIYIETFKGPNGGYFLMDKVKNYTYLNKYDIQLLEYMIKELKSNNFEFLNKCEILVNKIKNMHDIAEEKSRYIDGINIEDDIEIKKVIEDSIAKSEKVNILYKNINGIISERIIHPLHFFTYDNSDYVTAFCELRKSIRHFELQRITKIKNSDEIFQ